LLLVELLVLTQVVMVFHLLTQQHPLAVGGTFSNRLATDADLNEVSLEQALIDIAAFVDERGLKIATQGRKLIIPKELQFTADRLMSSALRTGTADNDINAIRNMGMIPEGYVVNHFLTDTDAFFIKTDAPNGLKHFVRTPMSTNMEGDLTQVTQDTKLERDTHSVSPILEVSLVHLALLNK
jgi:hypothetical protein